MAASSVVAVVVTYNRKALLADCLRALARQTRPPAGVVLVDNASTDGTREHVETSRAAGSLAVNYVRIARNGGGAEGFHYGVKHALALDPDWLWIMDDDCEPAPDCLERLLATPAAGDLGTTVLCPTVVAADGAVLPLNRLLRARRLVRSPLVPLPPDGYARAEAVLDTASFVGPLIRAGAARRAGLPLREAFIRFDDIEYIDRLRTAGPRAVTNVAAARIVHKEAIPLVDVSLAGTARRFLRRRDFDSQWKHLYGVRNLIFAGRRHGWMPLTNAVGIGLQNVLLYLTLGEPRLRLAQLALLYTQDGLRGGFRNVAPPDWPALAAAPSARTYLRDHRLRYDVEVDSAPVRLSGEEEP